MKEEKKTCTRLTFKKAKIFYFFEECTFYLNMYTKHFLAGACCMGRRQSRVKIGPAPQHWWQRSWQYEIGIKLGGGGTRNTYIHFYSTNFWLTDTELFLYRYFLILQLEPSAELWSAISKALNQSRPKRHCTIKTKSFVKIALKWDQCLFCLQRRKQSLRAFIHFQQ